LKSPHNSLQNEPKIAKNRSLSSSMHTTEVLFKFLKFLPLWLLMANKACEISEKPALKKPDGHPSLGHHQYDLHSSHKSYKVHEPGRSSTSFYIPAPCI